MTEVSFTPEAEQAYPPSSEKPGEKPEKNHSDRELQYINSIHAPIMSIDRDFNVTFLNENAAGLLGVSSKEAIGRKCYNLFKTEDCQTEKCACAQAMRTRAPATGKTVSRATGSELPIQYIGSPLIDKDGNLHGAIELVQDITELEKVIEGSQTLVEYLTGIQTPIVAINKQFTVEYMNEYGARLLGLTPEEAVGRKCYNLFKTSDCQTDKCACGQAMRTGSPATSKTVSKAGGGELPIQYTGSPLFDGKGDIIGAVEFVTDITLIDELAKNVSASADRVDQISAEILKAIAAVSEMGDQAANGAGQLSSSMQEVSAASQNVAEGSQNLSSVAQQTASNIEHLTKQMNLVTQKTKEVAELSEVSNKSAASMNEEGKQAITSLGDIKKASEDVGNIIGEVNSAVKNVAGLADEISAIAGEVNMLALNAAIEAARAGEAGRGFAVVADAVKQLAGQTGTAAKTAIETISGITSAGEKAGVIAQESGKASDKGDNIVQNVVEEASKVSVAMQGILDIVNLLMESVETTVKTLDEIDVAIQQVASISEESASSAEEASASIEEQTAATEQVAAAAEKTQEEAARAKALAERIEEEIKGLRAEVMKLTS